METGKLYWLDNERDVLGRFVGEDERGNYLFDNLINNYCYLTNEDGTAPMPCKGEYFLINSKEQL
jgi:hypothetical protein